MRQKWPAEYWLEGSVLLDKNFSEAPAEVFQLVVTVSDEACKEILIAVKEAWVKGNRAAQVCEALMIWEGFPHEAMEDSATSLVPKVPFV